MKIYPRMKWLTIVGDILEGIKIIGNGCIYIKIGMPGITPQILLAK